MPIPDAMRRQLQSALAWADAHTAFDDAVDDVPPALRGVRPPPMPYSLWELLEHLRRTQQDILAFCRAATYEEKTWPADYWPPTAAPPSPAAWEESAAAFRRDREALQQLSVDMSVDLLARVPNGDGQTYLRELLLVLDHNAYHIGEIVAVRRQLGIWGTG